MGRADQVAAWLQRRFPHRDAGPLLTMLERNLHCPPTSSMGRLFDAAAGLLGLRDQNQYEGQAAMELEGLAQAHGPTPPWLQGFAVHNAVLDFSPLLARLAHCDDPGFGAALFHSTVAHGLVQWAATAAVKPACDPLVVAGGCAMNAVLMGQLRAASALAGMQVLQAQQAPPNDGGLALGQGAIARQWHLVGLPQD
jgi:hydrogenase maturation protein HypF